MKERVVNPQNLNGDDEVYTSLRPKRLKEFIGQEELKANLSVFIDSAKARDEVLDHVLLFGPPGLGKTTLAQIIAAELGVGFRATSGPVIHKAGDLAAILTNLEQRDVLFIDEIHRLNPMIEEVLYSAMEDFKLDIITGEGPAARSFRIDINPFTLVGATTRSGLLSNPLRDRFGIPLKLDFYSTDSLEMIVKRGSSIMKAEITDDGAREIASRSRGTPRIAGRLLKRVSDFAYVAGNIIDKDTADAALKRLGVDKSGLDKLDMNYLRCIADNYGGGPVGIDTLAAALAEERDTLEEIVEPFLMQLGLIQRTPRGRVISDKGYAHLGIKSFTKPNLFEDR